MVFLFLICLFSVEDLFRFVKALGFLVGSVGDFVASDFVDLGEGGFEVECGEVEARLVDVGSGPSPVQVFGLDSQSSIVRFETVDVYVTTGALVGSVTSLVPGVPGIGWLGLRFRFKPSDELVGKVEEAIGGFALVRSGVTGRVFDGSYNEEAVRDEVRTEVEVGLVRRFGELGGDSVLLLDGPVFPTPKVLTMGGNPYSELYWGLVRLRVEASRGLRVVGVVKRLGQSTYYARCRGFSVDDDSLIKNEVSRQFGNKPAYTAVVGPVKITAGDYGKYCWYVASRLGREVNVVRVEALDEDLAEYGAEVVARLAGSGGVPIPIGIADRVSRRLNGSVVKLLASLSPLRLTYEGLEEIGRSLRELGE